MSEIEIKLNLLILADKLTPFKLKTGDKAVEKIISVAERLKTFIET